MGDDRPTTPAPPPEPPGFAPAFEVIPLDCEIGGYDPVGDDPLF